MNGNFADIVGCAFILFPYMLYAAAKEHKVVIPDNLYTVADNTTVALAMFHKVQFVFLMLVQRIGVLFLVTLHEMVAITLSELRDFSDDVIHIALEYKVMFPCAFSVLGHALQSA